MVSKERMAHVAALTMQDVLALGQDLDSLARKVNNHNDELMDMDVAVISGILSKSVAENKGIDENTAVRMSRAFDRLVYRAAVIYRDVDTFKLITEINTKIYGEGA